MRANTDGREARCAATASSLRRDPSERDHGRREIEIEVDARRKPRLPRVWIDRGCG
jgi:hypothetical protein